MVAKRVMNGKKGGKKKTRQKPLTLFSFWGHKSEFYLVSWYSDDEEFSFIRYLWGYA